MPENPYGSTFPKLPSAPRRPSAGRKPRGGPELEPLKGPAIEIPGDQKAAQEERWHAWQQLPTIRGSAPITEFIVWEWLVKRKGLQPGVDFIYQAPFLGGRTLFGGFVIDFYFPAQRMAWNPAGLRYHYTTTAQRARDRLAKVAMANRGIMLIYLWEDDLMERPEYVIYQAWQGRQLPGRDV